MAEYNFFATQHSPGAIVRDRWQLEADSFEKACELAQSLELLEAGQNEREPVIYETFEAVGYETINKA